MAGVVINDEQDVEIPEDYAAFTKYRDTGELPGSDEEEAPAAGEEETPSSEPADKAGQTAEDSDSEEEEQQEEEDKSPKGKGLAKRMRALTGEIKALKSQLAERDNPAESDEEAEEEVVSSPETDAEKPAEKLVRPKLSDFEDNDETGVSAWDQYEEAREAYGDARHAIKLAEALAEQKQKLEFEHAKAAADEAWNKAAARFEDYNDVVSDKVQISAAMESVMRMDADSGTALAYYMGQHPEESLRIAKLSLAHNEEEWVDARIRASMELGLIRARLPKPGTKEGQAGRPALPGQAGRPTTPAAPPQPTKKVTSASKPPTQLRGGTATPHTDIYSETDAADYGKWNKQREKELALQKRK